MEKGRGAGKQAGPSTRLKSAPIIVEDGSAGLVGDQSGLVEVLRMMRDSQQELNGILCNIRDKFRLWNNLSAYESFGRSNYGAKTWPGGRFAEWFAHWCHEDLLSVAETTRQQTEEQARLAWEVMEVWELGEAEGLGRD